MREVSAGLLMFRRVAGQSAGGNGVEVLLIHPGGPFWSKRDAGAWMIPKGKVEAGEQPIDAARRELREAPGPEPGEPLMSLGSVRQSGGKIVHAWAFEGDCDPATCVSKTFEMEWPPRSGKKITVPEVDRVKWFGLADARKKMLESQKPLLEKLESLLNK